MPNSHQLPHSPAVDSLDGNSKGQQTEGGVSLKFNEQIQRARMQQD